MAVVTQTSQVTVARQTFLPLLISVKHVIYWYTAQKSQHFSQLGSIVFQGGVTGSGKGRGLQCNKASCCVFGKYQSFSLYAALC